MLRGLITALRTLTVLPVPGKDADHMASSLPWFPFVGGLLGGILYSVAIGMSSISGNSWPQGAALVVTCCSVLLTKGLHLDGLADCADAFGNWHKKEKTLEIMKDPHTGVFGVVSIVSILLAKWICLTRIIDEGSVTCIISACTVSRAMQVELAASFPYARAEGGTAAPFIRDSRVYHRIAALVSALALLAVVNGFAGMILFAVGWIVSRLLGFWSLKRTGGVTGDVLGACSEIVETTALFLCASLGKRILDLYFY
jgi:adenosylcobinamide-GDP ribazoletransferase